MKSIVITGSTRGIGFALARAFLARQCQVVISSRTAEAVQSAVHSLETEFGESRAVGFSCDVQDVDQVQNLWNQSNAAYGDIDIWINNAGISNEQNPAWEIPVGEMQAVVGINILGTMYGTKVALQGFMNQGHGALYNMEGMGADGRIPTDGLSVYGMTKAGLHYYNKCLGREVDEPGIITGALQPGMVLTDLIMKRYEDKPGEWEKVKGILSVIANPVDDVANWLADKILGNDKNGAYFRYSSTFRILKRMLLAPFTRNK